MSDLAKGYAGQDHGCHDRYHIDSDWTIVRWDDPLMKLENRTNFDNHGERIAPSVVFFRFYKSELRG